MKIGQGIKQLRKSRFPTMRQKALAEYVGITQAYLSGIENGKKKASTEVLEKIANVFDVPLPILFWFTIDEKDIKDEKKELFKMLKSHMDGLIETVFM